MTIVKVVKKNESGWQVGNFIDIPQEKLKPFLKKGIVELPKEPKKKGR